MKKSIMKLVAVLLILAALVTLAFTGVNLGFFQIQPVKEGVVLGLDLVGGSEITYEAQIPEGVDEASVTAGMDVAQAMLRQRLNDAGYTEANVYLSGSNRVVVEIPNVSDPEEAVQYLGTTAVVEFCDAEGNVLLSGGDIKMAVAKNDVIDESGIAKAHVALQFTSEGQKKFAEATKEIAKRTDGKNYMAITMDGDTLSAPFVDAQYAVSGINSETAIITFGNNPSQDEVKNTANLIAAGQLPFSLQNVKLQAVGASLGERSLETSLMAGLIGIVLVCIFMICTYRIMGAISCVALGIYVAAFAVVLSIFHVNLSLPGIAGIILTVGMAVDANVVIYERIKEELHQGKTLRFAIDAGYNRAVSAIVDSNVTTIIAAVVLLWKGTGTILSFAMTLLLGVLLSMIIMLLFTKVLLKTAVGLKITNLKAYCA